MNESGQFSSPHQMPPASDLQAENSEIGDFRAGTFTLEELHEAIGWHIASRGEREDGDG